MDSAFQFLAAGKATRDFVAPTWLVLEGSLSAATRLLHQIRAWGAWLCILVALVFDLLVSASRPSSAFEVAWWRLSAARLRGLQDSASTSTADFLEHSFKAAGTRSFVAKRLAGVVSAFQWSTTNSKTDMLRLNVLLSCHSTMLAF